MNKLKRKFNDVGTKRKEMIIVLIDGFCGIDEEMNREMNDRKINGR